MGNHWRRKAIYCVSAGFHIAGIRASGQNGRVQGLLSGRIGLVVAVGLIAVIGFFGFQHFKPSKAVTTQATPPAAGQSTPPSPGAAPLPPAPLEVTTTSADLAGLTPADYPPTVTLLKPEEIRFKKGAIFTMKSGAPLFFVQEYLRDSKEGEKFEILDYDPAVRRVFLRAQDENGKPVALNTLDLHGTPSEVEPVPADSVVAFQGIADGSLVVEYQGDRFEVPVYDTDFLDQVAQRRAQRGGGN
jgi:hypothetical protein